MKNLEKKINIVFSQYALIKWDEDRYGVFPYIPKLEKIRNDLFSNKLVKQKKAITDAKSLLLSIRAWDGYADSKKSEDFVEGFNNFTEWYTFLLDLIRDMEIFIE